MDESLTNQRESIKVYEAIRNELNEIINAININFNFNFEKDKLIDIEKVIIILYLI